MIKKIFCFALAILFVFPLLSCASDGDPVSIFVATDLHYISPSLTENEEMFRKVVDNADGKVAHYSEEITEAFIDTVIKAKPDVLILSGDLTFNGAKASHEDLIKKLRRIADAGVQVLAQPGNHDVDSSEAFSFSGEEISVTESLSSVEFRELYSEFGLDQAISVDEASFSYVYQTKSNARIIMIDANSFGRGFIKDSTLEWLEAVLKQAKKDRADVITVSHQNLYAHSPLLSFGYQLYNASALEELLTKYKVKCHLSGHIHVQSIVENKVTEIATASLALADIPYGKMTYENGNLEYSVQSVDVSAWAERSGLDDPNLLDFDAYGVKYFKDNCYRQVNETFADSSLTKEQTELLAKTFADINIAYFMGDKLDATEYKTGLTLWKQQGSTFFSSYLDSMVEGTKKDNKTVTVNLD